MYRRLPLTLHIHEDLDRFSWKFGVKQLCIGKSGDPAVEISCRRSKSSLLKDYSPIKMNPPKISFHFNLPIVCFLADPTVLKGWLEHSSEISFQASDVLVWWLVMLLSLLLRSSVWNLRQHSCSVSPMWSWSIHVFTKASPRTISDRDTGHRQVGTFIYCKDTWSQKLPEIIRGTLYVSNCCHNSSPVGHSVGADCIQVQHPKGVLSPCFHESVLNRCTWDMVRVRECRSRFHFDMHRESAMKRWSFQKSLSPSPLSLHHVSSLPNPFGEEPSFWAFAGFLTMVQLPDPSSWSCRVLASAGGSMRCLEVPCPTK